MKFSSIACAMVWAQPVQLLGSTNFVFVSMPSLTSALLGQVDHIFSIAMAVCVKSVCNTIVLHVSVYK